MNDWKRDPDQVKAALRSLIDLWDMHAGLGWDVPPTRHAVNVAMINAYVSHAANLARGVLALHAQALTFESVTLVRSTMECAVTAAWLAIYPEKTPDLLKYSASDRKKLLEEMLARYGADVSDALAEIARVEEIEGHTDPEGRWLKRRFYSLRGGESLYVSYRALCAWDHAGNSLADMYSKRVERTEDNPWGIVLLHHPADSLGTTWLGIEMSLLLQAQIAADMVLTKPRHKTQLRRWAKRLGVSDTIARSVEGAD